MDAGNAIKRVLFNNVEFYIGGKWSSYTPKYPLPTFILASNLAKKEQLPFGAYISIKKGAKNSSNSIQLVMSKDEPKDLTPFGALGVAFNHNKWPNYKGDKTTVLILTVEQNGRSFYWINAIAPSGHVVNQFERLIDNIYEIPQTLTEIELTETPHYYYSQGDVAVAALLEQHKENSLGGYDSDAVPVALITSSISDQKAKPKRLYKKSKVELKRAGLVSASVASVVAAGFLYSHINTHEASAWLSNEDLKTEISTAKRDLQQLSDKFKPSKSFTPITYKETTIEQFVGDLKNDTPPPEVALTLQTIEDMMPLYAADWTMTKISYVNGDFLVYYTRDKGGKGVYFLLDEVISDIQKENSNAKIEGFALLKAAQERIYKVSTTLNADKKDSYKHILDTLSNEKKLQNGLRRALQNAMNDFSSVESAIDGAQNLSFTQRWLSGELNRIYDEAQAQMEQANLSYSRAKELNNQIAKSEKASINEEWVLGSVLEFVILMQTDSFFDWTYPEQVRTYPDQKTLKEKEPKKRKKRKSDKSDDSEVYGPAIETYKVTVSTQTSDDSGKVMSYGILDMIQLTLLIDRPFITISTIDYDPKSEQWSLTLLFNRKTPEFDSKIALK